MPSHVSNALTLANLTGVAQWVAWRNDLRAGKSSKVPYCAPGQQAESDKPSTWLTHDNAAAVAETIVHETGGGVGIQLGQCGDQWLAGVDLDTCLDPQTREIASWARDVLDRLATYAEVSPSGTGVKAFFAIDPADIPALRSAMRTEHGRQFKRPIGGDHPPAIELHISHRYFTVTWDTLPDCNDTLRCVGLPDLLWLIDEAGPALKEVSSTPKSASTIGNRITPAPIDDSTILGRLDILAGYDKATATALRHSATMRGGSRSEGPLGLGTALRRAGWSYTDMKSALLACPATAAWATEKLAEGERQFERIWDRGTPVGEHNEKSHTAPKLPLITPIDLQGIVVPQRQWIVPDWLAPGRVTALYGDGGTNKTLLAMMLATSCVTGLPWLGLPVMQGNAIGLFGEDDRDELHRRQDALNRHYGIAFSDLRGLSWYDGAGKDNSLVTFASDGRVQTTELFSAFSAAAKEMQARLVIIDTAADTFTGNENDRQQVRRFIGVLTGLARELDAAVLLTAHPSRAGLASGEQDGGSTAWSNSVRSRWSLSRPPGEDGARPDPDARILTRRKANYAAAGETMELRWDDGVLIPVAQIGGVFGTIAKQAVEAVFIDLMERCAAQGLNVSPSKNAANYAPKIFAKRPDAKGYKRADFDMAMHRLFAERRIIAEPYGRTSDSRTRLALACATPPDISNEPAIQVSI